LQLRAWQRLGGSDMFAFERLRKSIKFILECSGQLH